ncbi:MAG: cell wall hydrolase [Rhizobiaceae bacterium]|nr:cell wall hydrolase [Rhizobiaceae bacterium]MCV0406177.1 cell wall hydrolase [Rhizobiaceae bacterium]
MIQLRRIAVELRSGEPLVPVRVLTRRLAEAAAKPSLFFVRSLTRRSLDAAGRTSRLSVCLVAAAFSLGFPTSVAWQDMTSLVTGAESGRARWSAVVERSVAGSVHQAEMAFIDDSAVGVLSGAGLDAEGIGAVAFRGKAAAEGATPDEDRVVRSGKQGRLVKVVPVAPPKSFNAGSVFQRSSSLLDHAARHRAAFVKPEIGGREVEIASAFHLRRNAPRGAGVSPMLASLVTNEKPDVLATAYAPPVPDYSKASPFDSLLKKEDPNAGRFVPPIAEGDHPWMSQPLPAHVFSEKEQACLANAIYFEARGESLKGQAAVAQVVLNRVRNPAYPATICGVVYQNQHLRNRCQFSFACDGRKDAIASPSHYRTAKEVAMAVTAGKIFLPEVASSTHYYAQYVSPGWARSMQKMKKIGLHIFYRTYGGGWN